MRTLSHKVSHIVIFVVGDHQKRLERETNESYRVDNNAYHD